VSQRHAFQEEQGSLPVDKLVFLDETAVWCFMNAYYGWSDVGRPPVLCGSKHGKRLSFIGAMAVDGPRGHMMYEGTLNGDLMVEYIDTELGPKLRQDDIVVMDGLRVHTMAKVRAAIRRWGAKLLVLPPYSPELNPIELAWSTMKARIRKLGATCLDQLEQFAHEVWTELPTYFAGWIKHCGYIQST